MATRFCSDSAIIANRHCKNSCVIASENWCGALTMENVAYSDSTKMLENKNVLRTLTRSTFAHTRNSAGFTIHCLVAVSRKVLQNTLESLTREWILDSTMFCALKNMLLVHAWCMFLILVEFHLKSWTSKTCLRPSPKPHLQRERVRAAFKMLLWLMTFCKTLTLAAGFCCECL